MPRSSEGVDLRVRPAEPGDAEAMVQLTASGWRTAAGLRSPEGDSFTWVADVDGGPVG